MFKRNSNVFLEEKLDFLRGQSKNVQHFAEKTFESLAAAEVSSKARNQVVEQSKCLCEDYVYNRLATVLHSQQERYLHQTMLQKQQTTSKRTSSNNSNNPSPSPNININNINDNDNKNINVNINDNVFFRSISRLFSGASTEHTTDVFFRSSPDKVGLVRFEKWRNRLSDVAAEILSLGQRLEKSYPFLYDNLALQLKMPLKSEAAIVKAMTCIGDCMFENNYVTWYRIVGMFAVAGAVALEAVDNRKGGLITTIVHVFSQIIERHAAYWICRQGGWVAIIKNYQPVDKTYQQLIKLAGSILGFSIAMLLPVHFFY